MKILFSSLGAHGHTYPLIPLALAARDAGHDVSFLTADAFATTFKARGLRHVSGGLEIGEAFASVMGGRDPGKATEIEPELIAEAFGQVMPRRFAADVAAAVDRSRPDLVVHELGNPGAGLAARVAGVPALCHGFGRMWDELPQDVRGVEDGLVGFAAELGVELTAEHAMTLGNPYIDICPPSLQEPAFLATTNRIALRPVPFATPGDLPAWVVEHREPLVYLTLGTAFGDVGVLRTAVEGLGALDARVLVATGPTVEVSALGDVPANTTLLPWVPQADLLAHVDLVVHHGGSGTTMGSFGAGVPQLVLPQGADQFANAEVVARHGLGERLLGADVTAEAVTATARRLLADGVVRDAVRAIAAEVAAMPSPEDVARTLHEYA
ncbi:glycosyltransferase [Saccharothrix sp. Mg75]|uniref:glycosyltransferase n=1 Tax=Saccharothrix sp. Mg75 TaxID=3445357 RepID=UPI003EEB810F